MRRAGWYLGVIHGAEAAAQVPKACENIIVRTGRVFHRAEVLESVRGFQMTVVMELVICRAKNLVRGGTWL